MTVTVPGNRRLILALLCLASFATVFNNLIISPILPDISDDLGVRVAVTGLLVTVYAVSGGVAAIFAGPILDRLGRKRVVVIGMTIVVVATAASAVAPTFPLLMASRALAGLGIACLNPAVFAAVGDYFNYEERGRAMSWVIAANSSASIFGVPAGAALSGVLSWRWTFVVLALLCAVFVFLLYRKLPNDAARPAAQREGLSAIGAVLRERQTALALLSNSLSTTYWFVFLTYMGAFYHDEFGLAKWALGGLTMVQGFGVVTGSAIGGRLSDRVGKRPVIMVTTAVSGGFLVLETQVAPNIAFAAVFLLIFAAFGGARFAAAQAVMTEMSVARRSTVMALSASGQQFGIVCGSALGGLVLDLWGYSALGPAAGILALISAAIYLLFIDERKLGRQPGAAARAPAASPAAEP